MRVKKEQFIKEYTTWVKQHLNDVLPDEASEFRMIELTRRQHHHDVNCLLKLMKGTKSGRIATD